MRIIETVVYDYDELDETAQEKARDWYRKGALDYEWWDVTFDTIRAAGVYLGIDAKDIYFSGFYSQGDGACFVGRYSYRTGWRAALKAEFGGDTLAELEKIGLALQKAQRPVFYTATARVAKRCDHYSHENTVSIDVSADTDTVDDDAIDTALRDFMRWSYRLLEAEHDWLLADEQVIESIRANEYTFTADGEIA